VADQDGPQLDEALAGLRRIAAAAGIFEAAWQTRTVGETCDMIAAWCTANRQTPEQAARARAERDGARPEKWGPFHRHFASDAIHRDGGPECDQPGTPRRVYVFDPDVLAEHEAHIARRAAATAEQDRRGNGRA
jgi:hypothetical protein